jgi:hypothetical protein
MKVVIRKGFRRHMNSLCLPFYFFMDFGIVSETSPFVVAGPVWS